MDLPKTFSLYLQKQGASKVTIKNYRSDLNHFLAWSELTLKGHNRYFDPSEAESFTRYLDEELVSSYKNYLLSNLPLSTVNRRLSTLRIFCKFCLVQLWITEDPTKNINNIKTSKSSSVHHHEEIVNQFKKSLEKGKCTPNTIKNYLSDIRAFLNYLETV